MRVDTALRAMMHRWLIIAAITGAMAAMGAIFAVFNPPMYKATAEGLFSVASPETRTPYAMANGSQYILDRMTSYAQLGKTTPVLTPVVNGLHLDETPLTLTGRVTSKSSADKAILDVSVEYNDPVMAARIADATLAQIGQAVSRVENGNVKVTAVGPAVVPRPSSRLHLLIHAGVGAIAGLVLGSFVAVGLEFLRERAAWRRAVPLS
ncbi:YveK family protein [Mycobacterium sp. Marseille-P9652]|uniref:YveK family protein n=1 Tax=Mycobacterium sp. Marseille-P9652 TaxID=2654950 RepID=UPI0012E9586E|nr:hypothetical protein [Mycobacterium sp. Marseille-P9652]